MSAGAAALILVGIANQLRHIGDEIIAALGYTPDGQPPNAIVNVQITPEPSETVMEIETFSEADTGYVEVLKYTVEAGYYLYINELSIAPDTACKTTGRFRIMVGSRTLTDVQLLTTCTMSWGWLRLGEGSVIGVWVQSTDGTTNGGNVTFTGRKVRKET